MQQFLAPLLLPREIEVNFKECGVPSLLYEANGPATICYEYVDQIERMAPKAETVELAQGVVTREEAIVGPVVQAVLHQAALASFDALNTPVWGRRDDAADRVAAYVMLQFGENVAWSTIVGSAWFLAASASAPPDFADVRGTVAHATTRCCAWPSAATSSPVTRARTMSCSARSTPPRPRNPSRLARRELPHRVPDAGSRLQRDHCAAYRPPAARARSHEVGQVDRIPIGRLVRNRA